MSGAQIQATTAANSKQNEGNKPANGKLGKQNGSSNLFNDRILEYCFPFHSDRGQEKGQGHKYSLTDEKYSFYEIWGINHRIGGINDAVAFLNNKEIFHSYKEVFWINAIAITQHSDFNFSFKQDMVDASTRLVLKQCDLQAFVESGGREFFDSEGFLLPSVLLHVVPSKLDYKPNKMAYNEKDGLYTIQGPRITGVADYARIVGQDGKPSEWRGKADPQTGIAVHGKISEEDTPASNAIPFGIRPLLRGKNGHLPWDCNSGLRSPDTKLKVLFKHIPL